MASVFDEHVPFLGVLELLGGPLRGRLDLRRLLAASCPNMPSSPSTFVSCKAPKAMLDPRRFRKIKLICSSRCTSFIGFGSAPLRISVRSQFISAQAISQSGWLGQRARFGSPPSGSVSKQRVDIATRLTAKNAVCTLSIEQMLERPSYVRT